ncbi:putative metacaspase [Coleophoma crateriformis]|uniref:Putative metacaspase n=1 Tax=Coleophoma crateriformis TaxID=565419 RepID=A0A3D8T9E7_9HELO|nr:putative metacaspase [Coleophoma crateriformis]
MSQRKSLLVGINYTGSENELRGCHQDVENVAEFLSYRGYDTSPRSQVILRDDLEDQYYPSGHNILAAIDWLVSEPGTINFFHYSGHGGQVRDPTGNHPSGVLDTICPVDFRERGQINSDTLHEHLVSRLPPNSTLFVILDCCHSGSALELPFVYRSDDDGNVNLMDNIKEGMHLMSEAGDLFGGGFSFDKLAEAQDLYAGATSFFRSFKHMGESQGSGLGQDDDYSAYAQEHKMVTMFSGCRDDQTSADANINGTSEGAMSWAFLETMKRIENPTYLDALTDTRASVVRGLGNGSE